MRTCRRNEASVRKWSPSMRSNLLFAVMYSPCWVGGCQHATQQATYRCPARERPDDVRGKQVLLRGQCARAHVLELRQCCHVCFRTRGSVSGPAGQLKRTPGRNPLARHNEDRVLPVSRQPRRQQPPVPLVQRHVERVDAEILVVRGRGDHVGRVHGPVWRTPAVSTQVHSRIFSTASWRPCCCELADGWPCALPSGRPSCAVA